MSVAEIIEQIKTLSFAEKRELFHEFQVLLQGDPVNIRYATDEQARIAGDHVLKEHAELFRKLAQ